MSKKENNSIVEGITKDSTVIISDELANDKHKIVIKTEQDDLGEFVTIDR